MEVIGKFSKKLVVRILFLLGIVAISVFLYPQLTFLYAHFFGSAQAPQTKPSVHYQTVKTEKIHPWSAFSGKCRAIDYVEIRPRVTGVIQEVLFKEGALIKKEDPLFTIDPRPFMAALEKAQANLDSIISQEKLASIELKRTEKLVKTHVVAKKEFDERVSAKEVRTADIEGAKAALKTAQLDLDYAHIKSPIEGKISRAEITAGNLVEAGTNAPILTTIVSTSSIYVDFDMDEQAYIEAAHSLDTKEINADGIPIEVTLDGKESGLYKGHIKYFDNKINPSTGTIKVRAIVDNPKDILVSGIFVNVKVGTRHGQDAILIPDEAVGTDQNKKFVYLIDDQNKVSYREVKLSRSTKEGHIIQSGLKEGEKIVVKGVQRIRPGMVVDASDIKDAANKEVAKDVGKEALSKELEKDKKSLTAGSS